MNDPRTHTLGPWSVFVDAVQRVRSDARPELTVDDAVSEALMAWIDEQAALYLRL